MAHVIQWLRSLFFVVQMYLALLIMGFLYLPWVLVSRRGAYAACIHYCKYVRWTAGWMVGIKSEIRGTVPDTEVLIGAKHQSFWDVILIVSEVKKPKFIMKKSLLSVPIWGWFALRIGCVPVSRGRRAEAIKKMVRDVTSGRAPAGQLIIYPQGTRVAPGNDLPYKIGTFVLYEETGQKVVPAGTNAGLFWPKYGIMRHPGLAVVEFLDPIEQGLGKEEFMSVLKERIEECSNNLMKEAGFDGENRNA
jgi:1-acyl-sn-glycerol-3-phosphate acyltransferase